MARATRAKAKAETAPNIRIVDAKDEQDMRMHVRNVMRLSWERTFPDWVLLMSNEEIDAVIDKHTRMSKGEFKLDYVGVLMDMAYQNYLCSKMR
jgi:hypothetical protein